MADAATGERRVRHRRPGVMLALLAFAQFIVAVDYNIVFVALPDIGRALDFSPNSLHWWSAPTPSRSAAC